jgi:cell division protein FtsZ
MSTIEITALDGLKFELQDEARKGARIKVVGIGGAGANAVARMLQEGLEGVEFHVLNTDLQSLASSNVPSKIQIGAKVTKGLGVGSDPAIGRQAALEDTERICELLHGADMVFVTAGLGGGTGAGATPVVASLAKEMDALTVAVVTKPFAFEGPKRMRAAEKSIVELAGTVDTLITIPNDRLLSILPRGTSMTTAFKMADDVLRQAVQGISDIILTPGMINLDFSDIRSTMLGMGHAMMGTATARGENAAVEAAKQAIANPLLEDTKIAGARRILINLTGGEAMGIHAINDACNVVREEAHFDDLQINFGVTTNEAMGDAVKVTVIATGFHVPEPAQDVFFMPVREPEPAAEPEAVAAIAVVEDVDEEPAAYLDPDDLDTPAYLRNNNKMLN